MAALYNSLIFRLALIFYLLSLAMAIVRLWQNPSFEQKAKINWTLILVLIPVFGLLYFYFRIGKKL